MPSKEASKETWERIYPNAREKIDGKIPIPLGKLLRLSVGFDSDHAHNLGTRRPVTTVLAFINNTPFKWYYTKQAIVETSAYGVKLNVCKIAGEIVVELRH